MFIQLPKEASVSTKSPDLFCLQEDYLDSIIAEAKRWDSVYIGTYLIDTTGMIKRLMEILCKDERKVEVIVGTPSGKHRDTALNKLIKDHVNTWTWDNKPKMWLFPGFHAKYVVGLKNGKPKGTFIGNWNMQLTGYEQLAVYLKSRVISSDIVTLHEDWRLRGRKIL